MLPTLTQIKADDHREEDSCEQPKTTAERVLAAPDPRRRSLSGRG